MDELTLLRSTRDDSLAPSEDAREKARAQLLERAADLGVKRTVRFPRHRSRPIMARAIWALAGAAAVTAGIMVVGNLGQSTPSASAAQIVLRHAAAETIKYSDPVAGPGQYLHLRKYSRWQSCSGGKMDVEQNGQLVPTESPFVCEPFDDTRDLYMPTDSGSDWVMHVVIMGTGQTPGTDVVRRVADGKSDEVDLRQMVDVPSGIPADGDAAYKWIDGQYRGGSSNRDEDDFVRITDILRTGVVPAAPRAALLEALAKVPGVTVTGDVANLDGIKGVAIGRSEAAREGGRQEIIIDPNTGLVLGERTLAGKGKWEHAWGPDGLTGLTAFQLTVVDQVPALPGDDAQG